MMRMECPASSVGIRRRADVRPDLFHNLGHEILDHQIQHAGSQVRILAQVTIYRGLWASDWTR